jgi:hypothetical protein
MTRNQIDICSALLDYYHSSCTNHAIYILTVLLALTGFLQVPGIPPILESILISTSVAIEIRFMIRFLWWSYLANEVVHFENNGEKGFSLLHNKFVEAVRNRAKNERAVWAAYNLRRDEFQFPLLGVIWLLIFLYSLSYYGVIGSISLSEFSSLNFVLGFIGTVTGIASLLVLVWKTLHEKPIIKISDAFLFLEKKDEDNMRGSLTFNVDNLGDRSTTITRVNVMLGDHVEVVEGLRNIPPHSSVKYPEQKDSEIKLFMRYKEVKELKLIVIHTHDTLEKSYRLPQVSEWDKHALWKGGPLALLP